MQDFGGGGGRGKWVCPTDRELALRAILKTGWSVKSNSINSFNKPEQLKETEQAAIMKVIQRADNLERVEQERVGRLVERLDNMKKNAMGNGTTQCILCADEFGLLGASPLLCNDCRKAVCTKCGVDTVTANKEPVWLCKICAETRETWKKSGAWFYKGLPKYILPVKKTQYQSKYGATAMNRHPIETNTSSPARSYNSWLQNKGGNSREHTDSSDDEVRTMKLSGKSVRRYLSDSVESVESVPNSTGTPQLPVPKLVQGAVSPQYSSRDPACVFDPEDYGDINNSESTLTCARDSEQEMYRANLKSGEFVYTVTSPRRHRSRKDTLEDEVTERRYHGHMRSDSVSNSSSFTRGKGPASTSTQSISSQRQHDKNAHVIVEKRPSSHEEAAFVESASTLEMSILYDHHSQALHCTIYRAKGLKPTDYDGLADPYVQLQLIPVLNESDKLRTRTVHKTLNPEFNETVTFFRVSDYDMAKRTMRLTVLDDDPHSTSFMGESRFPLKKIHPNTPQQFQLHLDGSIQAEEADEESMRGQILISLMYSNEHHALIVGILRCIHLPPRDNNTTGYCDPYVRLHLKPDQLRRRYKTVTKKKTLNPEYNEEFVFEVKPHEITKKTLSVTVWDKDCSKIDDYIGGLALGTQSKGERLCHWLDVMRNPDRRIERWHPLSNAVMSE